MTGLMVDFNQMSNGGDAKGYYNSVMTYRRHNLCLVMRKTMIVHKEFATTPIQFRIRWFGKLEVRS